MFLVLKSEGKIYFACDLCSMVAGGSDTDDYRAKENLLFWKVNGVKGCLVGCYRDEAECDLFRYETRMFKGSFEISDVINGIAPAMLDKLAAYHKLDKDGEMKNNFVIAKGDRAYHVFNRGDCEELYDYFVFGSGREIAEAVLDKTAGEPAPERIRAAFECAEKIGYINAYPYALADTQSREIEIIEKP